jgi:DNA-binding MarR family transcriptional regulator
MNEPKQWVPMKEAAQTLKIDKSKISRWAAQGVIQTQKSPIDRRVRLVNIAEIRSLIERYKTNA